MMSEQKNHNEIAEICLVIGVASLIVSIWRRILPETLGELSCLLTLALVQSSAIILGVWFCWRIYHKRSWQALGLQKSSQKYWFVLAVLSGLVLGGAMLEVSHLINMLLPHGLPAQPITVTMGMAQTPAEMLIPIIVAGVLAPISEELLFRGFIYHTLHKRWSNKKSIIVTAIIFGCMHSDIYRLLPIAIGGVCLNLLSIKTRSLYTSMVAHSAWNMLMLAIIYWA